MPKWTEQQKKAIDSPVNNRIVSASAGSGKTSVLTERVLYAVESGRSIDRMLVLTFTNAAAAQMKEKIHKKIRDSGKLDEAAKREQLNRLDSAPICTFDAYALSLVRKYHQVLDVGKDITIVDENQVKNEFDERLDEAFEKRYEAHDPAFEKMIADFCRKSDENVREWIRGMQQGLELLEDPDGYLEGYPERAYSEEKTERHFEEYESLVRESVREFSEALESLRVLVDDEKAYGKMTEGLKALQEAKTYDQICRAVKEAKLGKVPHGSTDECKAARKEAAELLQKIGTLASQPRGVLLRRHEQTRETAAVLTDLLREVRKGLAETKRETDRYQYADIFRMAISLVRDHPQIRRECMDSYEEILVDEYQDTNDLQEKFLSLIQKKNIYAVGDIKQSIYRFRNANPAIFQKKYEDYKSGGGDVVELNDNFRSRKEVVEDINRVFLRLMDKDVGGAEYGAGHEMIFGSEKYQDPGEGRHMRILQYMPKAQWKKDPAMDEYARFSDREVEAFVIAKDIREKVKSHYRVMDEEGKSLRDCRYGDFCVLDRVSKNFGLYRQVFTYLGIPCRIEQSEKLTGGMVFTAVKNLLGLVMDEADPEKEVSPLHYCSVARSFLVRMSDAELCRIARERSYSRTELMEKIRGISASAPSMTLRQIVIALEKEFSIREKIITIGEEDMNMVQMDYIEQLASQWDSSGNGPEGFLDYLEKVFEKDSDIEYNVNRPDVDAVRIMTIHKSKGLEFPVCYYPDLARGFNRTSLNGTTAFDREYGMILPVREKGSGIAEDFLRALRKEKCVREDVSEQIRLLYVALTRAKEQMILVTPLADEDARRGKVPAERRRKYRSFSDMLDSIYTSLQEYVVPVDIGKIGLTKDYPMASSDVFSSLQGKGKKIVMKEYPHPEAVTVETARYSKGAGLIDARMRSAMDYGTKMHEYMEYVDLLDPDYEGIPEAYASKIRAFLSSDLMQDVKDAEAYREYPFLYEEDGEEKQGVIDLLLEYPDHMEIIDYKLKNIDDEHYDQQVNGYRRYVRSRTNKPVLCHLYSLVDGTCREVKEESE